MAEENKNTFKVALVGNAGVGKTCFLNSLTLGTFERRYLNTQHWISRPWNMNVNGTELTLDIWDKAGQERIMKQKDNEEYYKDTKAAIIMLDKSSINSLESLRYWYNCVTRECGPNIPIVVIVNKSDIERNNERLADVSSFCSEYSCVNFEISCKTGSDIINPLLYLAHKLIGAEIEADCTESKAEQSNLLIQKRAIKNIVQEELLPLLESLLLRQRQVEAMSTEELDGFCSQDFEEVIQKFERNS